MLRHVLDSFVREETLTAASGEIVNQHSQLPLSGIHGSGTISSSDAQRFRIRASSLIASYYPRYYGYYEKAIGIYTHVSDQYSVFTPRLFLVLPVRLYTSSMDCWKTIPSYKSESIRPTPTAIPRLSLLSVICSVSTLCHVSVTLKISNCIELIETPTMVYSLHCSTKPLT